MPVVAHPKLPSLDRPELKEMLQVDHSSNSNNSYQELHVALLNLMPDAALQATERQFISLLGSSNEFLVHVYPTSIDIGSRGQEYQKYIQDYYNDIQSIYGMPIDGLIISISIVVDLVSKSWNMNSRISLSLSIPNNLKTINRGISRPFFSSRNASD